MIENLKSESENESESQGLAAFSTLEAFGPGIYKNVRVHMNLWIRLEKSTRFFVTAHKASIRSLLGAMSIAGETLSPEPQETETWVKVHRRKGRSSTKKAAPMGLVQSREPAPGIPSLTLEQVKRDHGNLAEQWKSSPSYRQLQELLSLHTASTGISVTKAICFGLGTFDPPDGAWQQKRNAHVQLAAFLAIVEHLQGKTGNQIRCVFQEPIFNPVDKAFIASLGHEIVESPVGFQLVDPETLAFGVHLYIDVYSQVIATCTPAMLVGTSYETWEDSRESQMSTQHLDWTRMKDMDQACVKAQFPDNLPDRTFSSTTIHWRRKEQS
ncbi:hypothetical protein NUW58_g3009 [Xylaria curta]|uniref:Uncharacterized protein n=1 Tax=Xylaria curta TaxID=42375 RepID=A0ACC1PEI3_9PEZI|nr:hypothetical protein NUW58_g3009 [Xylaria curta]